MSLLQILLGVLAGSAVGVTLGLVGGGGSILMVPLLAGYIAYSIADRPGIAPGMIGGLVAANLNAGFLGGIIAGFIAGYGVAALNRYIKLPRNLEGLKPVLILPVLWVVTGERPPAASWAGALIAVTGMALIFLR